MTAWLVSGGWRPNRRKPTSTVVSASSAGWGSDRDLDAAGERTFKKSTQMRTEMTISICYPAPGLIQHRAASSGVDDQHMEHRGAHRRAGDSCYDTFYHSIAGSIDAAASWSVTASENRQHHRHKPEKYSLHRTATSFESRARLRTARQLRRLLNLAQSNVPST
jgi:hypothetical protein